MFIIGGWGARPKGDPPMMTRLVEAWTLPPNLAIFEKIALNVNHEFRLLSPICCEKNLLARVLSVRAYGNFMYICVMYCAEGGMRKTKLISKT